MTIATTNSVYNQFDSQLQGRCHESRKIGNNTYLKRRDDCIAIRLHETDILKFYPDGSFSICAEDWQTVTTKARLNEYLPAGYSIYQKNSVWYLHVGDWQTGTDFYFADCTIGADGSHNLQEYNPERERETRKQKRRIRNFAADYLKAFKSGKIEKPGPGDCFACQMRDSNGKSALGDSHIESHIAEKYFVPSMLIRAIETFPVSQVGKWAIASQWSNETIESSNMLEIGFEQLEKSLYRWLLRESGFGG